MYNNNEDYLDSEVFRKPIAFSCGLETQANGQLLSNCQTNELQSLVGDNSSNKEYLDDDFNYTYKDSENKRVFKKKNRIKVKKFIKLSKLFEFVLKFIYFSFRILLILLVFVLISFTGYSYFEKENMNNIEDISEDLIEDKEIENIVEINEDKTVVTIDSSTLEFKEKTIGYINELNSIIEGEKDCINNLYKGIVSVNETYLYFLKTQELKETLQKEYFDYNINSEYSSTQRYVNQIFIETINLSKSIIKSYLISDKKDKYITSMLNFIDSHNNKIVELDNRLDNLK